MLVSGITVCAALWKHRYHISNASIRTSTHKEGSQASIFPNTTAVSQIITLTSKCNGSPPKITSLTKLHSRRCLSNTTPQLLPGCKHNGWQADPDSEQHTVRDTIIRGFRVTSGLDTLAMAFLSDSCFIPGCLEERNWKP